jgi:hypothetical protein
MLKTLAQKMSSIKVSPAKILSQNSYLVTGISHPTYILYSLFTPTFGLHDQAD